MTNKQLQEYGEFIKARKQKDIDESLIALSKVGNALIDLDASFSIFAKEIFNYTEHKHSCKLIPDTPERRALWPRGKEFKSNPCTCGLDKLKDIVKSRIQSEVL